MIELWIVGRAMDPEEKRAWEFVGVFSSEEKAAAACATKANFIGPAVLNERLPDETQPWPGAYYPLAEGGSDAV
jgi:hypothetical protein